MFIVTEYAALKTLFIGFELIRKEGFPTIYKNLDVC